MQQSCTYGSVRGAISNGRPYRDKRLSKRRRGGAGIQPANAFQQPPNALRGGIRIGAEVTAVPARD